MTNSLNRDKEKEVCRKLKTILKTRPFFDCVGGCGVDTSNGESNCMDADGVWFDYCPFCGKEIIKEYKNGEWNWYEKTNNHSELEKVRQETRKECIEDLKEQIDYSRAHHEVVLDDWESESRDVFKTKREIQVFLNALDEFDELLQALSTKNLLKVK